LRSHEFSVSEGNNAAFFTAFALTAPRKLTLECGEMILGASSEVFQDSGESRFGFPGEKFIDVGNIHLL